MAEYFHIGKLSGPHGLKGEILLKHRLGKKTDLKGLEAVFLEESENNFIPWFIEYTRLKSETEVYIKLEGVNSREEAIRFSQKKVWLRETDFDKQAARNSPGRLLGYEIYQFKTLLGQVEEVIEQPNQLICRIRMEQKEVLIPLHGETLKRIDHSRKRIMVELPDGLLDIYLKP
ncbi:MAG: ribosome maturation factor RimM [Chitinophagaceae bacterium]|nr:ribosome maturation factor RimM [Chitinophagaceae bacterium]